MSFAETDLYRRGLTQDQRENDIKQQTTGNQDVKRWMMPAQIAFESLVRWRVALNATIR